MHDHPAEHSLDHSTDDSVDRPRSGSFTPAVLRPRELTPFSRGGGARTIPLVTRAVGAEVFLTGQTLFDGGAGIARHTHNCPESVTVLEGDAVVEIDGTEHHVTRFDTTYVPAGTPPPLPQRLRHRAPAHPVDLRLRRRHPHPRRDRRHHKGRRRARQAGSGAGSGASPRRRAAARAPSRVNRAQASGTARAPGAWSEGARGAGAWRSGSLRRGAMTAASPRSVER
ncbi:cupin domain-containing protein [Streptomyces olivaceus]|uniref:cupin domain-containing protein n=1 Tax=Streptomyces olivaceus TaxID=47716 RepID=UPI0022EEE542|nr:cupin domain-containing protein [Streptomyces olivaceus]GHI94390.1 hypothetical protein TPA0905_38610 [Streptomyces olivaceus]